MLTKSKFLFYFFFSVICLQVVGSLSFGIIQKINYYRQQAFHKSADQLQVITISKTQFEKYKINEHEIIIECVYYDIKNAESLDGQHIKLIVEQDKFETFLVFTSGLLTGPMHKKENKVSDFQLPESFSRIESIFPNIYNVCDQETIRYFFASILLNGFQTPSFQPPELFA